MAKKCANCGAKLSRNAVFCSGCGEKIVELPQQKSKASNQSTGPSFGTILAILLAVVIFLAIVTPIVYFLITEGVDFGKWAEDDILRDFNSILSGRKSPFQKLMSRMQYTCLGIGLFLCLPGNILLSRSRKYEENNGGMLMLVGVINSALLLTCWLLLLLFDFTGILRILILILCLVLALLWLVLMILGARNMGAYGIALILMSLALGLLAASYLAAFGGAGAVIFGDLFWIVLLVLVLCGGGTSGRIITVYIR